MCNAKNFLWFYCAASELVIKYYFKNHTSVNKYETKQYVRVNACTKRKNCHYDDHTFSESSSVCVSVCARAHACVCVCVCVCVELCQHNRLTELHM